MAGKSDCTPALAFKLFCEMGASRSFKGLEAILAKKGYSTSRTTLARWAKKDGWERSAAEGDALAQAALTASIEARHLCQTLQDLPASETLPFSLVETFQGSANSLHNLTGALAQVVTSAMERYLAAGAAVKFELDELLAIARVTVDLGKTTATMHTALNPPAKGTAPQRDEAGYLPGAAPIESGGPSGVDAILARFANPQRVRT